MKLHRRTDITASDLLPFGSTETPTERVVPLERALKSIPPVVEHRTVHTPSAVGCVFDGVSERTKRRLIDLGVFDEAGNSLL